MIFTSLLGTVENYDKKW